MNISFRYKLLFIIISVFLIKAANAGTAFADTTLTINNIVSDTTLDPSITYAVYGLNNSVWKGATLTIPAGTHIVFAPGAALQINGSLKVNGTQNSHVTITGGTPPPNIPFITTVYAPTQTPESSSPEVAPFNVSNTTMSDVSAPDQNHYGLVFGDGSVSTISYMDISEAYYAMRPTSNSRITADHIIFKNDFMGIVSNFNAYLKLTDSTFDTVNLPALWDFRAAFDHTNTTFINTGLNGWMYGGDILPGETMALDSTDGDYYLPGITFPEASSLLISPGVKVFVKDGQSLQFNSANISALGTEGKPIIFHGDGQCGAHSPVLLFNGTGQDLFKYVHFQNLCSGIQTSLNTLDISHSTFDTIAGIALDIDNFSTLTADAITMNDIYQALKSSYNTHVSLSDVSVNTVNTSGAAIDISAQSPAEMVDTTVDGASTCIAVSDNSSLTADRLTLSHCSKDAIFSNNTYATIPTGISVTNSDISKSGSTMNLTYAVVKNSTNNIFHNDGGKGVLLHHMPKTILINNDWGSTTGPTIASNPAGRGTTIVVDDVPEVVYRPWIGMEAPPEHNPIIIVPGITGSILNKDYGDKSELWPNIAKLTLSPTDSFLDDLELLQSGTPSSVRPVTIGDIVRSAGQVDVFDGLIASLVKNGYKEDVDLFVLPYDWRLSNTENQNLLNNKITSVLSQTKKDKVNIIAHSMGGLLVKEYLAQHGDAPIDHLFFVATPHLGAPKVFKALMYGDDMGYGFSLLNSILIHVLNPDRVKTITQNMPAVYELLPSQKYINTFGEYLKDLTGEISFSNVNDIASYMINQGRNSKMFTFAQTLRTDTDALDLSNIPTYNFVGCGATKTIGGITLSKEVSLSEVGVKINDDVRISYAQGDGVVPRNSAAAIDSAKTYYVTTGSHGTMPSVSEVQDAINTILNGGKIPSSTTMKTTAKDCAVAGEVVEVHSPVSLDIYDTQGHHTGLTANGDTELGIPNVDYEIIGNDKFAFLPTGPTYQVVMHSLGSGSYDMYISHSDADDVITKETYFNQVPIANNSINTVTIDSANDNYVINSDLDGDGTVETQVTPTNVVNTDGAKDTTPPTTSASIVNNKVTLTATDDNVGVLSTEYAINDSAWVKYGDAFSVSVGDTVQFFSQDKVGNVEDVKQITIPDNTVDTSSQNPTDDHTGSTTIITNNTTNNVTNNPVPIGPVPVSTQTQTVPIDDTTVNPTDDTVDVPDDGTPDLAVDHNTAPKIKTTIIPPLSQPTDAPNDTVEVSPSPSTATLKKPLLASVAGLIPQSDRGKWDSIGLILLAIILTVTARRAFRKK